MEDQIASDSSHESRRYPFGLSSRVSFLVVITIGLVGPGLGVSALEEANLPLAADVVWIVGYGTTILVVWFVWIRPLDIVGTDAQDWSERDDTEENDPSDRVSDTGQRRSETPQQTDDSSKATERPETSGQSQERTESES